VILPGASLATIPADEAKLLSRAAAWHPEIGLPCLTVPFLQEVSQSDGLDFATALVHDRLLRHPNNAAFLERFQSSSKSLSPADCLIGIAPGAFYREHKNTGADGRRIVELARTLQVSAELIPVKSFGFLAENAAIISEWLETKQSRDVILVSLSKGSTDIKHALSMPGASQRFSNVRAWISFSGIVHGTALVGWLRARPLRQFLFRLLLRIQGHHPGVIEELCRDKHVLRPWPSIPSHMLVVHVHGLPLRRHLHHPWALRAYERLTPLGPNDGGGILLGDLTKLPGFVCPIWAADHYLSPAWDITPVFLAIACACLPITCSPQAILSAT